MPTTAEIDKIYDGYYSEEKLKTGETRMSSNETALEKIGAFLSSGILRPESLVLDYGASYGFLVNFLKKRGFTAIGVETSEAARLEGKARYALEILAGLEAVPKNTVDYVLMVEVIEHLPDPLATARQLFDVLKPGGRIFLSTPNLDGLTARLSRLQWREAMKDCHLVLFRKASLQALLERAGFIDIRSIRFSPLTGSAKLASVAHRALQLFGLYGGLRMIAIKPKYGA